MSLLPPVSKNDEEVLKDDHIPTITTLAEDALLEIFSFLSASDIDRGLSLSCRTLRRVSKSPILWRELCKRTGKSKDDTSMSDAEPSLDSDFFFCLYHRVPCVPIDFPTIMEALEIAPPGGTITLLPHVFEERLVLRNSVRIRAADRQRGAAIVWHHRGHSPKQQGHEGVSSHCACDRRENESVVQIEESCEYVFLQNLTILHYSEGTDIWQGNCAIYCHGNSTHTFLDECSVQSDSGRGIVVSNGAEVIIARSNIHDCAATGVYLGNDGSSLNIVSSNILRNGFGRNVLDSDINEQTEDSSHWVQAGHSGLYVEGADAEIMNTLIAENCLTGLSVVRDGNVHLSHNVFIGNGADPVVIFHEEDDEGDDDRVEGAVYEHSNIFDHEAPSPEDMEQNLIRCAKEVYHHRLTKKMLLGAFSL